MTLSRLRQSVRQSGTLIGLVVMVAFFTAMRPETFLTAQNLLNISQQISMLAVAAFTMTIVMVMNDFDLSVGSMASLAGITAAVMFTLDQPVWLGVAMALAVGLAGGLANGLLVAYVRILPFIATLGTLTMFSGAAFLLSDGKTIYGRDIPASFGNFARSGLPLDAIGLSGVTVPAMTILAALVLLLVWLMLEHTTFGRRLYAIGGNPVAAELAGLNTRRLRLAAFVLTGLGAAVAGLMYASRVASANPTQGAGLMLDAIAAVFLGMTMGRQGEPRVLATLVGVLILGVLDNGLTQLNVDSYVRELLVGGIVLSAVALSSAGARR
jgi:ribose transport system permease protein